MTYRAHRASASPYEAPGEQDITAHVNFTALQAVADRARHDRTRVYSRNRNSCSASAKKPQFADAFQDCGLPQERAKVALQLKHLISPEAMGETFQVLVLSHAVTKKRPPN